MNKTKYNLYLKAIHVPYCFYPDPVGGTEIYVETLSRRLQELGVESVIVAPAEKNASYLHNGLLVRRFAFSNKINDLSELYNEGDPASAAEFGKILDEEKPDIVHIHALTRAVSLYVVYEAKKRGLPVIFTYHTPTVSCQRGTLMRWGRHVCDGKLRLNLCTRCTLHGLGVARIFADILGIVPCNIGNLLGRLKLSGGVWTALRMRELVNMHHTAVRRFMKEVAHIVVLCRWTRELLLYNNVLIDKISLSRQGICDRFENNIQLQRNLPREGPVKIVYIGRVSCEKGVDVVIRALRKLPAVDVEIHIYGTVQDKITHSYLDKLKRLAGPDPRIIFMEPVSNDKIWQVLENYDLLAVPSRWLETGPLVILEAFLAKVPVIGSDLGGIAELVKNEMNGLLVKYGSIRAWREVLIRVSKDRDLIARLRSGINPPRKMQDVALEMKELYSRYYSKSNEYV